MVPTTVRATTPQREAQNLFWLGLHQTLVRTGWIFKTESVIMPAFLDSVAPGAAAGTVRSLLPLLQRFGQGLPPLFFASWLGSLRHKKRALVAFALAMAAPFLALSVLWFVADPAMPAWPAVFLTAYGWFCCSRGLNQLSYDTLQERLGLQYQHFMVWVIVQNIGAGALTLMTGSLADAYGNRLALRLLILISAATPALAIMLSRHRRVPDL